MPESNDRARQMLQSGSDWPYDSTDEWQEHFSGSRLPPPAVDWAHVAARGVIAELQDRRGIKHGFNRVDEEVRINIVSALAEIVRQAAKDNEWSKLAEMAINRLLDAHESLDRDALGRALGGLRVLVGR